MWRKAAENFAKYTHKGSLVGIEGWIQTRSYENQQGQRVYVTEIVADNFSLLDSKPKGNQQNNARQASTPGDPFANGGQSIDIGDDSLPF
jgi:single-strand DNA-binding protein